MRVKVKKYHLGIRISRETEKKLKKLAEEAQRKLSDYCRLVLENHVKENNE